MRYTMNQDRTKLIVTLDRADRPEVELDVLTSFECEENDRFYIIVTDWSDSGDGSFMVTAGSFPSPACDGPFRPAAADELAMVNEVLSSIMRQINGSARLSSIGPGDATKQDMDELVRAVEQDLEGAAGGD